MEGFFRTNPNLQVSSVITNKTAAPLYVTSGLQLHLDAGLRESYPGSGTTWFDLSGNGFNGTLINSVGYSSSNQGSLTFNGSNQTVSVSKPNPNISGQITMSAWVLFNNYTSSPIVVHKGTHYTFQFRASDGTDRWTYADSTNYSYSNFGSRTAGGLYQTGRWMNVAVSKDPSNSVRLYKNGSLLDTRTSFGSAITTTNSTLWISGYSDTDTAPTSSVLNGNIAIISIYNRALSGDEINQNFQAFRNRYDI